MRKNYIILTVLVAFSGFLLYVGFFVLLKPDSDSLLIKEPMPMAQEEIVAESSSSQNAIQSAATRTLGYLLTDLEANLMNEAMDDKWYGIRVVWAGQAAGAKDPELIAKKLTELEANLKWAAVHKKWGARRDDWIEDCRTANTSEKVGELMLELERHIQWEAVQPGWKMRRTAWINETKKAQQ